MSVLCPRAVVGSGNAAQEFTSAAFPAIVLAFVLTSSSFSFLVLIQGPGQIHRGQAIELEEPDGRREVLQPVLAEVAELERARLEQGTVAGDSSTCPP